jgi:hypothetical protein
VDRTRPGSWSVSEAAADITVPLLLVYHAEVHSFAAIRCCSSARYVEIYASSNMYASQAQVPSKPQDPHVADASYPAHVCMRLPVLPAGKIEFGVINQSSSAFNHILNDVSLVVYQVGCTSHTKAEGRQRGAAPQAQCLSRWL